MTAVKRIPAPPVRQSFAPDLPNSTTRPVRAVWKANGATTPLGICTASAARRNVEPTRRELDRLMRERFRG